MLLSVEEWMDLRAFRALRAAGASWAEIARETGYDWRTVKKYLAAEAAALPPSVALMKAIRAQLDEVDCEMAAHVAAYHATLDGLLRSAGGVGPIVSAKLIAELPELGRLDRRQIAALVGEAQD